MHLDLFFMYITNSLKFFINDFVYFITDWFNHIMNLIVNMFFQLAKPLFKLTSYSISNFIQGVNNCLLITLKHDIHGSTNIFLNSFKIRCY